MYHLRPALSLFGLALALRLSYAQSLPPIPARQSAVGVVFHDRDRDGVRDAGEEGLKEVRVSNGREIVLTDGEGRWRLPVEDETILFVIKPRDWMTPVDADRLPKFYYIHKPKGSPASRYPGVAPTGPLPASVNFPLHPQTEPGRFRAVIFGDTQARNQQEIDYMAHDVIEDLVGVDAAFGVTLGDLVFNDLSLYPSHNRTIALIGIPWYNVLGNHDLNFDSPDDAHSDETFERVFGPSYYSFDYGPVHFVVLDDVIWTGPKGNEKGAYTGGLGEKQLEFLRRDLALVPKNQLVVLGMHIPLNGVAEKEQVFRLLEDRPFSLSLSAHTHFQEHRFFTSKEGWRGSEPHHHIVHVTVCGSWWRGAPDERGVPHATMSDGAPNGHSIITFDGTRYAVEYKAARRPADYQMAIHAPEEIEAARAGETEVLVNVFAGSERSVVEMRLGENGSWQKMERVTRPDPDFLAMKALEESPAPPPGLKLPKPHETPHLWRALFPANPPAGTHLLHVRTTDMFGQTYADRRVVRIR